MSKACLNCNAQLQGNFCIHCGQSAKTHRFTIKHVFTQDFLFAIFHVNRGLLFSVKELFTRPGHSAREYIDGKRVSHLNYFTLLVIALLVFSLIEQITPFHFTDLTESNSKIYETIDKVMKEYPKFLYIGIIPLYAVFSYLFFGKAKQNYAENFVLNSFRVSATIIMNILFLSFASIVRDISIIRKADGLLAWIGTGYGTWFYYQYFSPFYSNKLMLVVKSLLCAVLPGLIITLCVIVYFVLQGDLKLE
jgi:Protein of unknown function (DUF3667)